MSFQKILGQNQPINILRNSIKTKSLAHAYLLFGQGTVGKRTTALEFAKTINCLSPEAQDNCGKCISCEKIEKQIHPDVFFLSPSKTSPTAREEFIRIEDIRGLQKKISYLPFEGKYKIVIIDQAEQLNLQAANAFLKSLEEPPKATVFLLVASNIYRLLPTILSRCQSVRFNLLTRDHIEQILRSENPEQDLDFLKLKSSKANGDLARARDSTSLNLAEFRKNAIELIDKVSFNQMDLTFEFAREWKKRNAEIPEMLDELSYILRDLAIIKLGRSKKNIFNGDLFENLSLIAEKKKLRSLYQMFEATIESRVDLRRNLNVQLTLENMLIKFCEAG